MTYGLDRRLPAETAPGDPFQARKIHWAAWRKLDEHSRLQLIEGELRPANELIDGYPPAL